MGGKACRLLGPFLFGMMSLGWRATAQESMYSADSLMSAFEKGSGVSLKGALITFRDVVVESEDGKLTFKSTQKNRVICRLITPTGNRNKPPSAGSEATVIGKVRGRGLLGNVTLDNCSMAPLPDSPDSAKLQQDIASVAPVDPPSEENVDAASLPARPEEVSNDFAPIPSAQPPKQGTQRAQRKAAPSRELDRQDQATGRESDTSRDVPYRLYALLVLGGAVGYSILSKLLSSTVRAMRSSKNPTSGNTDDVRKAALEALLMKSSKKK
jgi:type IV secretory pathway VirB10-like protein